MVLNLTQYVFDFLELADSKTSLEICISLTNAIKVSANFFRSLNASSDTPPSTSNACIGNIAAVNKRSAQPWKVPNCNCGFCGLKTHPRTKCAAQWSTFLKFGKKGHWAAACMSNFATVASDNGEQITSVLRSVKTTNEVTSSPNRI